MLFRSFNNWTTGKSTDYRSFSLSNHIALLVSSPVLNRVDQPTSELSSSIAPGFDTTDNNGSTDTLDDFLQQLSQGSQLPLTQLSPDPVMQELVTPHSMPKTRPWTMTNPLENWSHGIFMNQSDTQMPSVSGPGFVEFSDMISGFDSTMLDPSSDLTPDELIAQSEATVRQAKLQKMESLRAELAILERDTAA